MSSSTIVFETHATSLDNEAGLASGWYDVDLSQTGQQQALDMRDRHRATAVRAVYCSDLRRSWHTADIAFSRRCPIIRDPRLRECDYGELTRTRVEDIDRHRAEHVAVPFPGGESYEQVAARVGDWLVDVLQTAGPEKLVVVGHRATYYALEHLLRRRPLTEVVRAPWTWQAGWIYEARTLDLPREEDHR